MSKYEETRNFRFSLDPNSNHFLIETKNPDLHGAYSYSNKKLNILFKFLYA